MAKILLSALLSLLITGCSRKEVVEATYENGNPKIIKHYHKKGGELILDREVLFYENKQKRMDGEYKDGLRSGSWKAWYKNGKLWSEAEFNDGKRNGAGTSYHENGKKYIESMYRDDTRVGAWRFYDTAGVLTKEVDFDHLQGILKEDSLQ